MCVNGERNERNNQLRLEVQYVYRYYHNIFLFGWYYSGTVFQVVYWYSDIFQCKNVISGD
jgi:hypothetical protein